MKSLQDLEIFVRAVDGGSLSAAARTLDITPAAASAALKRLEAELGVQLLARSTRSLRLTPIGEQFLAQCGPALEALQQAGRQLAAGEAGLRGVVRLAAPSDLGRHALLDWLDAFGERYPGADIRLQLSDRPTSLHREPVDAALHYGAGSPGAGLVALPLAATNRRVLCASREYLERRGVPATPRDLPQHDALCVMNGDEVVDRWRFAPHGRASREFEVSVTSRRVANDSDAVRRWAVQGRGIAYLSAIDVAQDVALRHLTVLCTQWNTEALPLALVVSDRRPLSPLLEALRAFIAERVAQVPIESIAHSARTGAGGRRRARTLG